MIMTFEEYNKYLADIDIRIAEAGRRITYREIQIIGRQKGASSMLMAVGQDMTEEEKNILENDKTLLALRKEYDRLVAEKYYVIKYAEMPMTASDAINNCDRLAMLYKNKEKIINELREEMHKNKEKED